MGFLTGNSSSPILMLDIFVRFGKIFNLGIVPRMRGEPCAERLAVAGT
jgi:hypothetical protein